MAIHKNSEVYHNCIEPLYEDVVVKYIYSGVFVHIRRKFRRCLTVSTTGVNSKNILKSSAAIREETHRHLQTAYYLIHPFSDAKVVWEYVMMITFFGLFILVPFKTALRQTPWFITVPIGILDIICCCDICISFNCGYYDEQTTKIILNRHKVAMHYLKSYFLIDFLSSVPNAFVTVFYNDWVEKWVILCFSYLKILRIHTFLSNFESITDRITCNIFTFKIVKFAIIFTIVLFWLTSFRHLLRKKLEPRENESITVSLLTSCLATLYNILLIGHGFESIHDFNTMSYVLLCFAIGFFLEMFIYTQALHMLHTNISVSNRYQNLMQQIQEYVRYKHIPENVKKRILQFFDFKFEKSYYKESEILDSLSESLKQDIFISICQNLIEKVEFFQELPIHVLIRIIKCMKSETFLCGDVIVKAGVPGETMYFIFSGTTAVYTHNGKEICHLCDGNHFGEVALIIKNEKRIASVVAIESCDLYTLHRKDFLKAIEPYPDLKYNMKKLAEKRLQTAINVAHETTV